MAYQNKQSVLTMEVSLISLKEAVKHILYWAVDSKAHYVCVSNVHMCMETYDSPNFRKVVNQADLIIPDGKPLVWILHWFGFKQVRQIRGYDLMLAVLKTAEKQGLSVGFYGGTRQDLKQLSHRIHKQFPQLTLSCTISPPFGVITTEEDKLFIQQINQSKIRILFVCLGCPKQENWMASHKDKLSCVMIGVGAALSFYTGKNKQAPLWMHKMGLEWLYRFVKEPQRLKRRYLKHNPRFIVLSFLSILNLLNTKADSAKQTNNPKETLWR
jgi:N-acetylglucosaminyldiphosphoundecaprenol N-acetyl-beta-D-mannosaminyltransferase